MARILNLTGVVFACATVAISQAQGGGFGGGQGGGFGGGQGPGRIAMESAAQNIDQKISKYLNGDENETVLTPGEYCEWILKRKAGQIIFAEARSSAFDPALEILDSADKVLAKNDDRYLGDQRPLLVWRCPADGEYKLHLRCFHDKSGGQAFVRFKSYDCFDVLSDRKSEFHGQGNTSFILRVPLKAGQIKEVLADLGDDRSPFGLSGVQAISPTGLPDIDLSAKLQGISTNSILVAPVDGDYYLLEDPIWGAGGGKIRLWTRDIVPSKLVAQAGSMTGKAPTRIPTIFEISAKAGELLQVSVPELDRFCRLLVTETPDVSKNDMSKPEGNPFVPQLPSTVEPAIMSMGARADDNRIVVFYVKRDAKLWLACNGAGPDDRQYTLRVRPAAEKFEENRTNFGKLRIADTDYWEFDAQAGEVLTLDTKASGFRDLIIVNAPNMREIRHYEAGVDETSDDWRFVVSEPGRYLVHVSCVGNGGSGDYAMRRTVLRPKEFEIGKPVLGEIAQNEVQIWKFTMMKDNPLLMRWTSSDWQFNVGVYDEKGRPLGLQRDNVDDHTQYGIVRTPGTYLLVLTGAGPKSTYSIDLAPIPGYRRVEH